MYFGDLDLTLRARAFMQAANAALEFAKFLKSRIFQPLGALLAVEFKKFFKKSTSGRQPKGKPLASRPGSYQQVDFELLAAFPVDRANPPAAEQLRFLKARYCLLQQKLESGTVWLKPLEEAKDRRFSDEELELLAAIRLNN